jgi:hypothetical protein
MSEITEKPSSTLLALRWGAILGVALILYSTLGYVANLTTQTLYSLLLYVVLAGGLALAMRDAKARNDGFMTYGQGMGLGALVSAVAGMIYSTYSVLYTTVIDPNAMDRVEEAMRTEFERQGKLTDEQIDQTLGVMNSFQSPGLQFIFGILTILILGTLLSLIVAAVMQKRNKNPFA